MEEIIEKENRNLSSFEEIKNRKDPLYGGVATPTEIKPSIIKEDTFIILFKDGSQANVNQETLNKLLADSE